MGCFRPTPVAPASPLPDDHHIPIQHQNPPDRDCRNRRANDPNADIRGVTTTIIISLTVIVPVIGFTYLLAMELGNVFHYASFQVDFISFSLPGGNSSAPAAESEWDVEVSVRNPAKRHSVSFRDVEFSVWYNATEFLTAAAVENFCQGPKGQTKLRARMKAKWGNSAAIGRDGVIDFDLRVRANATYPLRFSLRKHHVGYDVVCRELKVGLVSPTPADWRMVGGSQQCSVKTTS